MTDASIRSATQPLVHPARLARWARCALALSLALTAPAYAQPGATLSGRVVDRDDRPVAAAEVIVRERGVATEHRTISRDDGSFEMSGLRAGRYLVDAKGPQGLRAAMRTVEIQEERAESIDLRLDLETYEEQVVVTAESRPQPIDEVGKSITVVDRTEIEQRGEVALPEVLRRVAGVQIRQDGGPGQLAALRIRGLRSDGAAVLIDGFRFRDAATTQGDASPYLSNLEVINIDRVEVLRGSASSLYGTNAVGGTVNIVSSLGGARPGGDVEVAAGQLGEARVRSTYNGAARGGALRYSVGGLFANVADGIDGNDASRSAGVQGGLVARFGRASTLTGRVWASDDRVDLNTSPSAFEVPTASLGTGPVVAARPLPRADVARLIAGEPFSYGDATLVAGVDDPDDERTSSFVTAAARFMHQTDGGASFEASYQRLRTDRTFLARPGGTGFQPLIDSRSDFGGRTDMVQAVATKTLGARWLVTGGYELEHESYEGLQQDLGGVAAGTDVAQDAHALFARAGVGASRRLHVATSLRVQLFRLATPRFLPAGTASAYDGLDFDAPPAAVTGDLSAIYKLDDRTRLRAHVGNAYRAPSLYERFGGGLTADPATGRVEVSLYGDPRLEPDRYVSLDGGVERDLVSGRVRATYFETWIQQLTEFQFGGAIDAATDPFGRFGGYLNGDGGRARGLELEGDWRAGRMALRAGYTLTDSRTDKALLAPDFFRAPSIARHTLAVTAVGYLGDRLELVADLFARSAMYASMFTADGSRAYEFPSTAKLDLGGAWIWRREGARRIRAYAKVDNVLDREYYELGWLAPGATLRAGLTFTY